VLFTSVLSWHKAGEKKVKGGATWFHFQPQPSGVPPFLKRGTGFGEGRGLGNRNFNGYEEACQGVGKDSERARSASDI